MTRGRARRYLLTQQGYYPGVVAAMGYDVWDWSTLNAGTLFQDSAKTTPASANGDVVGCWTDGVGGVDATQVTTANKPGLDLASLNGSATLSFDGGDLLATGNITIGTFAAWCVFKASGATGTIVYEHSVNSGSGNGTYLGTSDNFTIYLNRSGSINRKLLAPNWANDNTWRVVRHDNNGTDATHTLSINSVLQSLTPSISNNVGTGATAQPLFIGARSGVVAPITGNIAHLCIVSPYPTDASILVNMESYINGLWGVY